jgi:hypothetical protein
MVKIGATIIGTETELILKSTWVVPTKLLQAGLPFHIRVLQVLGKILLHKSQEKSIFCFKRYYIRKAGRTGSILVSTITLN